MALAIAEFLQKPCKFDDKMCVRGALAERLICLFCLCMLFGSIPGDRFIAPVLKKLTPDDYDKWVPIILSWITKSIAMSIAWYIQAVISGVTSSLKGGLMMANAAFQFCTYRKISLFGLIPEDTSKSVVDEFLSYLFAALGFYVQFRSGFSLPAPLKLVFWPLEVAEYYIRWTITKKKA